MLPPHPTPDAFQQYQQFVSKVLDKTDVEILGNKRVIKRSGWRKLALAFGVSFELQSEDIVRDQHYNVVSAKFVYRAILPNGRFSDGWGSCCPNEKKFMKPNHDCPATAETRAKNRACADVFGIGDAKR
uniref:Uncharacterized protein n=1 Tax=Hemiselmis andersenii TaxID=464988 RepID=A0A7S1DYA4_HEMAN